MSKISIIIPCFNAVRFIQDTINSVLEQNFTELEIICVNDGSSDNTLEILHKVSSDDSRIVVIDQENAGSSAARNRGILASSGEYLCFLDADDLLPKNALLNLYKNASAFDSDIAIGNFSTFNEFGTIQNRENFIHKNGAADYKQYFNDYFLQTKHCLPSVWGKLYRASLIKDNAILFPNGVFTAEDVCFSAKVILCATKISKTNQNVYCYRVGENNMSGFKSIKVFEDVKSVCSELERYFDEHKSNFSDAQNELLSSYLIKTRFLAPLTMGNEINEELYKKMMNLTYPDLYGISRKNGFALLQRRHKALFYLYEICPNQKIFEFALNGFQQIYLFLRKFR